MATHAQRPGVLPRPLPTLAEVTDGLRRHELVTRACAIAFRILFAVVPFALFLLALAGLLSQQELWTEDLAPSIGPHVSTSLFAVLDDVAINALSARQVFWTTAGLTLAIWEVSSAARVVMGCLDDIYGARRRRSFAERLPTSLWLGPACGLLVVGAIASLHLAALVLGGPLGTIVRYLLAAVLLWACVALVVRFGSATRQPFQWVSFGTTLVVVGWLVSWTVYGVYLTQLAQMGSFFGAFAAFIVLLTFLELSCIVLLAGALIDALAREHAAK